MKKTIFALAAIFAMLFSCSSGEVKSSKNYIEKFEIDISPIEVNVLPQTIYVWTDLSKYEELMSANKQIECSPGASLDSSGSVWTDQDFKYIVKAENGEVRTYSMQIDTTIPKKYSFETWKFSEGPSKYYMPSDLRWTSGNPGISMALGMLGKDSKNPEHYPTRKTDKGYNGSNAVIMETIEGGRVELMNKDIPVISGNFFLGYFNTAKLLTDELAATEVGRAYPDKPKSVKGWCKYKEGPGVFNNNGTPEPGRHDLCNVHVSFYQSDLPGGDTTLAVRDIDTSSFVIADATMEDCLETCSETCLEKEGDGFCKFTLPLIYKEEPDFKSHRYKIAITFAASKDGDTYAGKIGSTFIVDEVEIEDY